MIVGFDKQTRDLTEYERTKLLPIMCKCFRRHIGEENAISNREICEKMTAKGYIVSEARVRKIINHIRTNALVPCLMANGNGYYITTKPSEMSSYIQSIHGRIEALIGLKEALEKQYMELTGS